MMHNKAERHIIKKEMSGTSASHRPKRDEHDLAFYIHDRVELMHQVFSVIKYKELKVMAPACVREISIEDLKELCTEELLGISSKRLCAILDGAEPPSDTDSSSQSPTEKMETISLDSISSDEEILSQEDKSKKKKHKHRRHSSKSKRKKLKDTEDELNADKSRASRAGLTVLELLELQARARAIRAQLQQEQTNVVKESTVADSVHAQSSEDEVEIKEEPAEVVEISSDEEKPKIEELESCNPQPNTQEAQPKTVTKHVKDLIITVPQQKTQKIKLNRTKCIPQDNSNKEISINNEKTDIEKLNNETIKNNEKLKNKQKNRSNKKDKKKKKKRLSNASDNDEITLQLSDTEKMDLLEDLDRKSYENFSTDSSPDSESESDTPKTTTQRNTNTEKNINGDKIIFRQDSSTREDRDSHQKNDIVQKVIIIENKKITDLTEIFKKTEQNDSRNTEAVENEIDSNSTIIESTLATAIVEENKFEIENNIATLSQSDTLVSQNLATTEQECKETDQTNENSESVTIQDDIDKSKSGSSPSRQKVMSPLQEKNLTESIGDKRDISEGELSDKESSELEVFDLKSEIICISDEENKPKKKKRKKEKKSKEKKSKKKHCIDQNIHKLVTSVTNAMNLEKSLSNETYKINQKGAEDSFHPSKNELEVEHRQYSTLERDLIAPDKSGDSNKTVNNDDDKNSIDENVERIQSDIAIDSNNVIVEINDEIYELSDDSSNEDETEMRNVLSKEPTASEIEALSAKIDEIETDVITEEELKESNAELESWRDRYLGSKKVKRVLNTSNILNALRKKNREIKKGLEESKIGTQENLDLGAQKGVEDLAKDSGVQEGSIEQYNTLDGSNKYVDPVKEPPINDTLKKDAKQLLKMYKKLLKYNDMNRKKEPSKKNKKKKSKKEKEYTSK